MGNRIVDIFPPANRQEVERFMLDIVKIAWKDDYVDINGRAGQSQRGLDVMGICNDPENSCT